ncbi:hypothetical protein [Pandoravirus japonicus]|uniref:Uncharacterized protein n=1 Tax=Pandoravirus japonicus TaxID=2823154 RepID=A0A811BRI0_9VIRU|nr:hypothetical protein [Pandoravirus japonicus]
MSRIETTPTGQIGQALAAADPSTAHLMRIHGLRTLDRVLRYVPRDARTAALSTALAAGDAEIIAEIVTALDHKHLHEAIDDLSHDPSALEKIYEAVQRRDDLADRRTDEPLITSLAIKGRVESLAIVMRHSVECRSSVAWSTRILVHERKFPHALRTLLDVCASEPKIGAETRTRLLIDALVAAANGFNHGVIDALVPICTPYVLHEALLRCPGNTVSHYAFDNIWRVAEGAVCAHQMASGLRRGKARIYMRRCIRDLGKGRPCKSVDCIYGPACASRTAFRPGRPPLFPADLLHVETKISC